MAHPWLLPARSKERREPAWDICSYTLLVDAIVGSSVGSGGVTLLVDRFSASYVVGCRLKHCCVSGLGWSDVMAKSKDKERERERNKKPKKRHRDEEEESGGHKKHKHNKRENQKASSSSKKSSQHTSSTSSSRDNKKDKRKKESSREHGSSSRSSDKKKGKKEGGDGRKDKDAVEGDRSANPAALCRLR